MRVLKNILLLIFALNFSNAIHAQTYYRTASTFDALKLDKVPLAKQTIKLDFKTDDSVGVAGKTFYLKMTTDDKHLFKSKDGSLLAFLGDEDVYGFIVTSVPENQNVRYSVYYRYTNHKKANQIPDPEIYGDGPAVFKFLAEQSGKIVDPRTLTYYTVYNDMPEKMVNANGVVAWNVDVTETENFTFVSPDTIIFRRYYFVRKADNYFEASKDNSWVLFTQTNGTIIVRINFWGKSASAAYAPSKTIANQLLEQDYKTTNDLVALNKKSSDFDGTRDDRKKAEIEKALVADVSKYVASLKSLRKEPTLEQAMRKKFSLSNSVLRIYFLDETWQVVTNYYGDIVNKKLTCVVVFKDSKDGSCFMKYWNIQYPYTGSGTYGTEFELGTTYPSKQNTSTQDSWLRVDNSLGGSFHNVYAGNSYDIDCAVIK